MAQRYNLSEEDLHRIIKECIVEALDEVSLGGESLHGNNPADWMVMGNIRSNKAVYGNDGKMSRHSNQHYRDVQNMTDVADKQKEDGTFNPEQFNGAMNKARNISHNLDRNPIKKYVSDKMKQLRK